jgi:hypothetical protein
MQRAVQSIFSLKGATRSADVADALAIAICCGHEREESAECGVMSAELGCGEWRLRFSHSTSAFDTRQSPAMISALTGTIKRVDDDRIHLECGPMLYELLIPAADVTEHQANLGETLTLHTIFYLAGDPSRGGLERTLIAFLRPQDKQFFELFTTREGHRPERKRSRRMTLPTERSPPRSSRRTRVF